MNPNPPLPPPKLVIQLTDTHLMADETARLLNVETDASLRGVIAHILATHPGADHVLVTGDISQDGSAAAHRRFLRYSEAFDAPVSGLPGNHDEAPLFRAVWGRMAQPVVDLGRWRMVLLDSSVAGSDSGRLGPAQLRLLEQALAGADGRHVLVALHHNPLEMGSAWLDTMTLADGEAFFDLLARHRQVRAVLWGHVHQEYDGVHHFKSADRLGTLSGYSGYDRSDGALGAVSAPVRLGLQSECDSARSIRLLACPSTCFQFAPGSREFKLDTRAPGYRWLRLHDDGRLETGIQRVPGLNLRPDTQSSGY